MRASTTTVNVVRTVPTPTRISTIVNSFRAALSIGSTSRKPTVESVVMVW